MKLIKRVLLFLVGIVFALCLIVVMVYRNEAYQLYKVVTFFDPEDISENFRSTKTIFQTREVPQSSIPYPLPMAAVQGSIPDSFQFNDSIINTSDYLDQTLTDALLILQHDSIRYEYYSNGFQRSDTHISFSMSKSVISALFGIAIEEGYITGIDKLVTDYLPELKGTGYDGVIIKDVLQMSSGVGFNEDYSDFDSDINVLGRYFALGMPMADFAKRLKREREPGTYNLYVSVDTQVLGMILTRATGKTISDYMYEKLWEPLGATSTAHWIIDKAGMEFAIGGLNCTARDYARMGQLYLDTGRWESRQLVPEAWVIASITPDAPHLMPGRRPNAKSKDGYGYQWWIPVGREDEFNAQGIYTQFIYIDPDKDMVIVKLSSNYHFKNDTTSYYHDHEIALYREIAKGF